MSAYLQQPLPFFSAVIGSIIIARLVSAGITIGFRLDTILYMSKKQYLNLSKKNTLANSDN